MKRTEAYKFETTALRLHISLISCVRENRDRKLVRRSKRWQMRSGRPWLHRPALGIVRILNGAGEVTANNQETPVEEFHRKVVEFDIQMIAFSDEGHLLRRHGRILGLALVPVGHVRRKP